MKITPHATTVLLALCGLAPTVSADVDDLRHLLDGVTKIAAPGVPGPLCVFSDQAFPVAVGGSGRDFREPVVAAARAGSGRVVAFGHDGYFGREALGAEDTGRLMTNAIRWVAGESVVNSSTPRVGVRKHPGLVAFLKELGIDAAALDGPEWTKRLGDLDVVCGSSHPLSEEDIPAIREYVRGGGGLVTGGLGWGWLQLHPGKTLADHPGNRLLASLGIVWADGYLSRTADTGYETTAPPSELCHATRAIDALVANAAGGSGQKAADLAQAVWTATRAVRSLPADDGLLRPRLRGLRRKHAGGIVPTSDRPVTMKQPLDRLLLTLELEELKQLPPDRVRAHPAAESFPGAIPTDVAKVSRAVEIDARVPGWHSTGLYAGPGQVIVAEVPEEVVEKPELQIRIGAHNDSLWGKDAWKRCPEICRSFALDAPRVRAANAFGGPVYIDVPENSNLGIVSLKIRDGIAAPHYVLGETESAEWRETIRHLPAPWAELESGKITLTVPSSEVRELDDPEALMMFWNDVSDACAALAARPLERERPERYVADRQISAGYMHSGYPIMTHLDAAERMVSVELLKKNAWGLYHELGHNHQSGDWTFGGTGEVTVNLFTLHVFDAVCDNCESCRPKLFGEARAKTIREHLAAGAPFERWKHDPFLALLMYMQIREAFGWEVYKQVFAEYRDLPKEQRPRNDEQKRDQWLVRLSKAVGRDLGPFFVAWGVPTSEQARASITDLPVWMPEGFPPQ